MRASALTLAAKCRGSARLSSGFGSIYSSKGNAFHELARDMVLGKQLDFEAIKIKYGLTEDMMKDIKATVYSFKLNLPPGARVFTEYQMKTTLKTGGAADEELTGQPDFFTIEGEKAVLVDWKQGWADVEDPESNNQFLAYDILIFDNFPEVNFILNTLVQPKLNSVKTYTIHRGDIEKRKELVAQIIREAASPKAQFTTGPWCSSCFSCMRCPAFAGEIVTLSQMMAPQPGVDLDIVPVLRRMLPFAKAAAVVADKIVELAKAYVENNGPLELGGGMTFVRVEEKREDIGTGAALDVLEKRFGDKARGVIKFSKTDVMALCSETKKRGLGKEVLEELRKSGAVKEKSITKYTVKKGADHGGSTHEVKALD